MSVTVAPATTMQPVLQPDQRILLVNAQLDIQTRYVAVSEYQLIKTKQDIHIEYLKLDTKFSP